MVSRMKGRGDALGFGPERPPLEFEVGKSRKRSVIRTFTGVDQGFTVPNPSPDVPSPPSQDFRQSRNESSHRSQREMTPVGVQLSSRIGDFTLIISTQHICRVDNHHFREAVCCSEICYHCERTIEFDC